MGKSNYRKDKKHSKDKKDRHEAKEKSHSRRDSPSPPPIARYKSRHQQSASPPAHKRRREAERTPSPPLQSARERRNKKRAEDRTIQEDPAGASPAKTILGRIRFPAKDQDGDPKAAPAQAQEDNSDLRRKSRDQYNTRSLQYNARDRETRDRPLREAEAHRAPRGTERAPRGAAAAFVPEEQFWQQRKGGSSPPRRDEDVYERSHRPAAPHDGERDRGKSSVLARLTFLGFSPQAKQLQPASPSRDAKRWRQGSPDGRPPVLSSAARDPPVVTHARVTSVKDDRAGRDVERIAAVTRGRHDSHDLVPINKSINKSTASGSQRRGTRSDLRSDGPAASRSDRDWDTAPWTSDKKYYQQSPPPEPGYEQYGRMTRQQQGRSDEYARVIPANQRQGSRKRHRQEREEDLHGQGGRDEWDRGQSPPPRSTSRGKSKGRVYDEGGGGGGYRGEDPVRSDMQGEGAEEEQGDQKSGRTRSGNEKEKRSKDKDKSKRKKEHKESKKRKKEGKREREMEGGEEEPAYEAYSPRGRSLDLREPGGSEHRDDLVKSTGGAEHHSPQKQEEPLIHQQSPKAPKEDNNQTTSDGRLQNLPADSDKLPLWQSPRSGSLPLPPPPQANPSQMPDSKADPKAAYSPARDLMHGTHASAERPELASSPGRGAQGQGKVGGMRGRSNTGAKPPPGSPNAAGSDTQGSPDRRRNVKHAGVDYNAAQAGRDRFRADHVGVPNRHQQQQCQQQPARQAPAPPPGAPPSRQQERGHRPVPPAGPPPPLASQNKSRQQERGAFMERREWNISSETGDGGGGANRGGWVRPTDQTRRMHEHGSASGAAGEGGRDVGDDGAGEMMMGTERYGHDRSKEVEKVQEGSEVVNNRQERARFPIPLVVPGYAVVGGVGQGRTMPGAVDVWRKVLARELNVPAAEGSVVGAAVHALVGTLGGDNGKAGVGASKGVKSGNVNVKGSMMQLQVGSGVGSGGGGWRVYQGALRRAIDPAAWLEVQPKLRVAGAVEDSDEAWRKKVQACTNTVFQCSELLKVMKRRREAAALVG